MMQTFTHGDNSAKKYNSPIHFLVYDEVCINDMDEINKRNHRVDNLVPRLFPLAEERPWPGLVT
jgi:hypothetical protein